VTEDKEAASNKSTKRAPKKAIEQKAKPGVWTAALIARSKSLAPRQPGPKSKNSSSRPKKKKQTIAAGITSQSKSALERWSPKGVSNNPARPHRKRGKKKIVQAVSAEPKTVQTRSATPTPFNLAVDRLILDLPKRSMAELHQQWINVIERLATSQRGDLIRFRDALMDEWGRRFQIARHDPDHFEWPSTEAGCGDGSLRAGQWYNEGMLSYLGYRVGRTQGVSDRVRRQILDSVFSGALPPVNGVHYVQAWGDPSTASRLKKLAQEIAAFVVNAKRRKSTDLSSAIADWESDLKYLHRQYYIGKFGFGWPRID
jgi:hypothetical protein